MEHIVVSLAEKFESGATTPWSLADSDPANRARLRGIVGFELRSTSVQVKLKLNQNHPVANVAGVIAGLRDTGSEEAAAVAALMQKKSSIKDSRCGDAMETDDTRTRAETAAEWEQFCERLKEAGQILLRPEISHEKTRSRGRVCATLRG